MLMYGLTFLSTDIKPTLCYLRFVVCVLAVRQNYNSCGLVVTGAETNSDFCYSNSCFLNDRMKNNWCTHTERDGCTHTHKVVVVGGTHNLQQIFSPTISKYFHTGLLKGLHLLELAILYNRDT